MKLKNVIKNALLFGMLFLMGFAISSCNTGNDTPVKYKVEYMVKEADKAKGSVTAKLGTENFTSSELVESGKTISFVAEAKAGFEVDKWMVNGKDKTPTTNKKELNLTIQEQTLVVVSFVAKGSGGGSAQDKVKVEFMVDATKKHGGIIAKNGSDTLVTGDMVQKGSSIVFKALPNENYAVDKWMVNGEDKTSTATDDNKTLTLTVNDNVSVVLSYKTSGGGSSTDEVKVEFTFNSGTITAKNGATAITSGSMVAKGSTIDFEVKLRAGLEKTKEVDKWMVNSEDKTPTGDKTKLQLVVNENTKVEVSAKLKQFSVTFSADDASHGSVSAMDEDSKNISTGDKVDALKNVTFTPTATGSYKFDKWMVNDEEKASTSADNKLTIAIDKDTIVKAIFKM